MLPSAGSLFLAEGMFNKQKLVHTKAMWAYGRRVQGENKIRNRRKMPVENVEMHFSLTRCELETCFIPVRLIVRNNRFDQISLRWKKPSELTNKKDLPSQWNS